MQGWPQSRAEEVWGTDPQGEPPQSVLPLRLQSLVAQPAVRHQATRTGGAGEGPGRGWSYLTCVSVPWRKTAVRNDVHLSTHTCFLPTPLPGLAQALRKGRSVLGRAAG